MAQFITTGDRATLSGKLPLLLLAVGACVLSGCTGQPSVSHLFPATTYAGSPALTLTLLGRGFEQGASASFNGVSRETVYISANHLTVELTAQDLAAAGVFSVTVTNPGDSKPSRGKDFTLLSLIFGETDIATPDWSAETHGKLKAAAIKKNLSRVFDTGQVQRLDIAIDSDNWAVMQSNLAALRARQGWSTDFSMADDPVYVPCDVVYNGITWYRVGIRFKGNSSLYLADCGKLPFKLKFDEFETMYPAIDNQRFYGFKSFSLKSNYRDESELHELVAAGLFRDFGLASPHCAFYRLYVDTGAGPVYYGLYTLVEEVDDTVIKTQYDDDGGNLYKPQGKAATFSEGSFNTFEYSKKTNEGDLDYSDVQALHDALHSRLRKTDPAAWKTGLEAILDVPVFLKWLAANTVLQNWDTYGVGAQNYYLYRNPATRRLEWIAWDNNEALVSDPKCISLSAREVTARWPLIRYLLDDTDYAAQYRENVHGFATSLFNTARMAPLYDAQAALIQDAVQGESEGYSFTSAGKFTEAIAGLKTHVAAREAAALAY